EVSLAEEERSQAALYGVHPALFDAALHGFAAHLLDVQPSSDGEISEQAGVRLPFSLAGVSVDVSGASSLRVRVARAGEDALSLLAADDGGQVVLAVRSLVMRPIPTQLAPARGGDSLFRLDWVVMPMPSLQTSSPDGWVALGPSAGEVVRTLAPEAQADSGYEDLSALGDAIDAGRPAPEIVLVGLPAAWSDTAQPHKARPDAALSDTEQPDTVGPDKAAHAAAHEALALTQAWLADRRFAESRLVVLTRGAVAARSGEEPDLGAAPVWGLLRSAQTEDPGRLVLADIDEEPASVEALAPALAGEESQLAIREGMTFVPRLARMGSGPVLKPPAGALHWRLQEGRAGTLESLQLVPAEEAGAPLQAGEVRVGIRAAALNFRDVVSALGVVSLPEGENLIGSEGAGVVLEVGPGVEGLEPGDRVMGLLFGAFGTAVVQDRRMIVPMPAGWSFTRAASLSGAFLTAYYGLVDLAALQPGERLLVHAAAGGVGMAAVQMARHLGAQVWATASPGKWDVLRGLGIAEERIASSRDLAFREQFLQASGGGGLDVVLNSLAGEYVDASCELLRAGGRLIEMGKTDIRDPKRVAEEHPGVGYRAFDLLEAGPDRIQQMLIEILQLFDRGVLEPLPVRTWDVRRAPEAFRFMSQARHVGKIVLTSPPAPIEPGGTALITGGTGELGALLARHLVAEHGMRSLVLVSRRGPRAPGAEALRAELEQLGARVAIEACDVSERRQLAAVIDAVPGESPLSVVVHCAGVLDDGVLSSLTDERIEGVFASKVDAAWHLHELTLQLDLEDFILFSSGAGTLGTAGQANYAAANVFLDALAAHRRARGLPAVSMAWGGWAQASEMTGGLSESD